MFTVQNWAMSLSALPADDWEKGDNYCVSIGGSLAVRAEEEVSTTRVWPAQTKKMRSHLCAQRLSCALVTAPLGTSTIPKMPLDTLPAEILSLLANGVDAAGHPILDPRYRFHLAQVSRALRACISCPSTIDAARLARHPGATQAWIEGRAASIALLVGQCRSGAMTPQEAGQTLLVPCDPCRGEVAALVATAPSHVAMPRLASMVQQLQATALDWFADSDPETHRDNSVDTKRGESPSDRDQVYSNVVVLACRLARADIAIDFFRWSRQTCRVALRACLRAAVDQDDGVLVSAMLCHMAQDRDTLPGRDHEMMRTLFYDALATAASRGKIGALRYLLAKSSRGSRRHLSACSIAQTTASQRGRNVDHMGCAFAASGLGRHASLSDCWTTHAAAHNRTDVFAQAKAERGFWCLWPFGAFVQAVTYGSIDVADFMALGDDPAVCHPSEWEKAIADAITHRCPYDRPAIDADRLARGMNWLRDRGVQFTLGNIIGMARRIEAHPDLVQCVLAVETPLPDTEAPPLLCGHDVRDLVWRGQWAVLSRAIIAYGRAADEARSLGKQPSPTEWWAQIEKMIYIERTPGGLCLLAPGTQDVRALSTLYRIAQLCGRIPSSPGDDTLADTCIGQSPIDPDITPASWTRWCSPVPLWCAMGTYDGESDDGACEDETRRRVGRMLVLLADAGLVRTNRPMPMCAYSGFASP